MLVETDELKIQNLDTWIGVTIGKYLLPIYIIYIYMYILINQYLSYKYYYFIIIAIVYLIINT